MLKFWQIHSYRNHLTSRKYWFFGSRTLFSNKSQFIRCLQQKLLHNILYSQIFMVHWFHISVNPVEVERIISSEDHLQIRYHYAFTKLQFVLIYVEVHREWQTLWEQHQGTTLGDLTGNFALHSSYPCKLFSGGWLVRQNAWCPLLRLKKDSNPS